MYRVFFIAVLLAFPLLAQAARSNVCLYESSSGTVYSPLQIYENPNCPGEANNCMKVIYNYNAALFRYDGPSTLRPKPGEVEMFLSQDDNDYLDAVVIVSPTKSDTTIQSKVAITGATPAAVIQYDDPPPTDNGVWDSNTNSGNFSWIVQPTFTDGIVVGHLQFDDGYCVVANFQPTVTGSLTSVSFLTGNVTNVVKAVTKVFAPNANFTFCQYPHISVSKVDIMCPNTRTGSAMATLVFGPPDMSYRWTNSNNTVLSNVASLTGVMAGVYTVTATSAARGCGATIDVEIKEPASLTIPLTALAQTVQGLGSASVAPTGGHPPYTYTWRDNTSHIFSNAANVTGLAAGNYTVTVSDNCGAVIVTPVIIDLKYCPEGQFFTAPSTCTPCRKGTYSDGDRQVNCTVCPPGTWNNVTGALTCNSCPKNTYSVGGIQQCTPCAVSYFSNPVSGLCQQCPPGTERAQTADTCTACLKGYFRCSGAFMCQPCQTGTISTAFGSPLCTMCDPGSYQGLTGKSACQQCPMNTYGVAGATKCTTCSGGSKSSVGSFHSLQCN